LEQLAQQETQVLMVRKERLDLQVLQEVQEQREQLVQLVLKEMWAQLDRQVPTEPMEQ